MVERQLEARGNRPLAGFRFTLARVWGDSPGILSTAPLAYCAGTCPGLSPVKYGSHGPTRQELGITEGRSRRFLWIVLSNPLEPCCQQAFDEERLLCEVQ